MDEQKLKNILLSLKELHEKDWKNIESKIDEHLTEIRILLKDHIENKQRFDLDTVSFLKEKIELINSIFSKELGHKNKLLFWIYLSKGKRGQAASGEEEVRDLLEVLNNEDFQKLLLESISIERVEDINKLKGLILNASRIDGLGGANTFAWLSIMNSKIFIPAYGRILKDALLKELGLKNFWYWDKRNPKRIESSLDTFFEFTRTAIKVSNDLDISDMLELSFYLGKFGSSTSKNNNEKRKFLEIVGEKFLEKAEKLGIKIDGEQLRSPAEEFRKIYLPSEIREIAGGRIHYEWLIKGKKINVGLHFEFEGDDSEKNNSLLLHIEENVNLKELGKRVGGEYNLTGRRWKWIHIAKPYSKLDNNLADWAVDTMVELYRETIRVLYAYFKDESVLQEYPELISLLKDKGQIILYGPPGTGKTWLAQRIIASLTEGDKDHYEFVTFHPSYSYEEFVEGLKPVTTQGDELRFVIEDGIFKRLTLKAICTPLMNSVDDPTLSKVATELYNLIMEIEDGNMENYDKYGLFKRRLWSLLQQYTPEEIKEFFRDAPAFYLVIDEINRGDISKIFGELITLLERDKRLGESNQLFTLLPYSKESFSVPPNLYIIGTMNTADRSIALIDVALRRRFGFKEIMPSYRVLMHKLGIGDFNDEKTAIKEIERWNVDELGTDDRSIKMLAIKLLYEINKRIKKEYDRDHQIGHSYLLKLKDAEDVKTALENIWIYEILPLLQEYFYDSPQKLKSVLRNKFVYVDKEGVYDFVAEDDVIGVLKEIAKK